MWVLKQFSQEQWNSYPMKRQIVHWFGRFSVKSVLMKGGRNSTAPEEKLKYRRIRNKFTKFSKSLCYCDLFIIKNVIVTKCYFTSLWYLISNIIIYIIIYNNNFSTIFYTLTVYCHPFLKRFWSRVSSPVNRWSVENHAEEIGNASATVWQLECVKLHMKKMCCLCLINGL